MFKITHKITCAFPEEDYQWVFSLDSPTRLSGWPNYPGSPVFYFYLPPPNTVWTKRKEYAKQVDNTTKPQSELLDKIWERLVWYYDQDKEYENQT